MCQPSQQARVTQEPVEAVILPTSERARFTHSVIEVAALGSQSDSAIWLRP